MHSLHFLVYDGDDWKILVMVTFERYWKDLEFTQKQGLISGLVINWMMTMRRRRMIDDVLWFCDGFGNELGFN